MKESMGWIKVNRRLLENPISNKPAYISLWIHLLLMANHQESSFIWNNKKEVLKKGQLLTGIKVLAKKTGIAEGTVYRILKYLENEKQIEQQKTTKFTVITIVNWCKYQENEEQNAKQIKNRLKTDRKQNKTYKNDKNEENDENDIPKGMKNSSLKVLREPELWEELSLKFNTNRSYIEKECEKMEDWLKSKGKTQKDYKAFARNWIRRATEKTEVPKESPKFNILNTPNGK
jgi:DNA-binding transcriptional regulator YhcF (GntR family)